MSVTKVGHDFNGHATVAEFRTSVGGEWLDAPNVKRGTHIYARNQETGECREIIGVDREDSGVYLNLGGEVNPQEMAEDEVDIAHADNGPAIDSF